MGYHIFKQLHQKSVDAAAGTFQHENRWDGPWTFQEQMLWKQLQWIGSRNKLQEPLQKKSGWWYTYPSEKYEFVSWDDDSQYMEK